MPSPPLRLNLGCGLRRLSGYLNVDKAGEPDLLWDLERLPWPWEDGSVDEVVLHHVLEHLGERVDTYLGILREIYRVCRPGALVHVTVPHPRHDNFLNDPTHVRAVTPESLGLLSKAFCRDFQDQGAANTPLAFYLDVDFELTRVTFNLDEPWRSRYAAGEIDDAGLREAMARYNNVAREIVMELRVLKEG